MVKTLVLAVALPRRIDERQVARLADRLQELRVGGQVQLLERDRDFLGEADADETAGGDRVAVADQAHGVDRRHHLAELGRLEGRKQRMRTRSRRHARLYGAA